MKFSAKIRDLIRCGVAISLCILSCRFSIADEKVPVPWNGMDIGGLGPAGGAQEDEGTFTLTGGSGSLTGARDAFQFVYQSFTGDCTLSARVTAGDDLNGPADAGLMVRDALATTSDYVAVAYAPGRGVMSAYRNTVVPMTGAVDADGNSPVWVKLIKRGSVIRSYSAPDQGGVPGAWKQIGANEPIASGMIYVGLCLVGRATGNIATARFDHVTLTTGNQPLIGNGLYTLSPANAPDMVLVADAGSVNLAASTGAPTQAWRLVEKEGGFYSVRPAFNEALVLTVPGSKSADGTKVIVDADQGRDAQQWSIVANSNNTYSLLPRFDTAVGLDDYGGNVSPDAVIDIWGYNGTDPHLQWTLLPS